MILHVILIVASLAAIIIGAKFATKYAVTLAENFRVSKYFVGFLVVAVISILPETLVSLNAALSGNPELGLATLFGSNVADLTLVFAIVILFAGRGLKVEGKIIKNHVVYPLILLLPIILGINGHYSRMEGVALLLAGGVFYYIALRNNTDDPGPLPEKLSRLKSSLLFLLSIGVLLVGSHYAVTSALALSADLSVSAILIGVLVIGLGTTLPELMFAINSVKGKDDSLAIGDILGTVLADGTIVVGLLALVSPFKFPVSIIYFTGAFMVLSSFVLFYFMRTEETISRKEGVMLLFTWLLFITVQVFINN